MKGKVALICGHEAKRVAWQVTMDAGRKNEARGCVTMTADYCPKCYQQKKRTKGFLYARRGVKRG